MSKIESLRAPITADIDRSVVGNGSLNLIADLRVGTLLSPCIDGQAIGDVLTLAAAEMGQPTALLTKDDFYKPLSVLHGNTLGKLEYYAKLKSEKGRIPYLLEQAGIQVTSNDVIERIRAGGKIYWSRVPAHVFDASINIGFREASRELQIPASMMGQPDFFRPFRFLNDNNLSPFFFQARNDPERKGQDTIGFLLNRAGIPVKAQDIIDFVKGAKEGHERSVYWERVPKQELGFTIMAATEELGIPASMLHRSHLFHRFEFLEGKTLSGIYGYAYKHPDRKGKNTITFIKELAGIEVTDTDVINFIKTGGNIQWDQVPPTITKGLLERVAVELHIPVSLIGDQHLTQRFNFLGGASLAGMRARSENGTRKRSSLTALVELSITTSDVLEMIRSGKRFFWNRIPMEAIRQVVNQAADEIGVPVSEWQIKDFKRAFNFLGGNTLWGLYGFLAHPVNNRSKNELSLVFEKLGIETNAEAAIQLLRQSKPVYWNRLSWEEISRLLEMVAKDMGMPAEVIDTTELTIKHSFLNNNSLGGLYGFLLFHPQRGNRGTIEFLQEQIGIRLTADGVIARIRAGKRILWDRVLVKEVAEILDRAAGELKIAVSMLTDTDFARTPLRFLGNHTLGGLYQYFADMDRDSGDTITNLIKRKTGFSSSVPPTPVTTNLTLDDLIPWIEEAVNVVRQPGMTREEIEVETYVYVAEEIIGKSGFTGPKRLINGLRKRIKAQNNDSFRRRFTERSLQAPIKGSLTLEGVLATEIPDPSTNTIDNPQIRDALSRLSKTLRQIVLSIAVEGKSYEETGEELEIDSRMVQNQYESALDLLRQDLDK